MPLAFFLGARYYIYILKTAGHKMLWLAGAKHKGMGAALCSLAPFGKPGFALGFFYAKEVFQCLAANGSL